jgi:hypothetical protein
MGEVDGMSDESPRREPVPTKSESNDPKSPQRKSWLWLFLRGELE